MAVRSAARDGITALTCGLQAARDFFGVAKVMCNVGKQSFGLHQLAVHLLASSARPILVVDNAPWIEDETRIRYLAEWWALNPFHRALCDRHAPIGEELFDAPEVMAIVRSQGYAGDYVHTLALPILDPAGMLGAIYCGQLAPFADELRRDLTTAATYVAVRLAQLQITAGREAPGLAELTSRQLEIAQLASHGRTNAEVSAALEISENTVKKHLKDIFERIGLSNRTQLAALFARVSPRDDFPPGVSRRDGLVITKRAD